MIRFFFDQPWFTSQFNQSNPIFKNILLFVRTNQPNVSIAHFSTKHMPSFVVICFLLVPPKLGTSLGQKVVDFVCWYHAKFTFDFCFLWHFYSLSLVQIRLAISSELCPTDLIQKRICVLLVRPFHDTSSHFWCKLGHFIRWTSGAECQRLITISTS